MTETLSQAAARRIVLAAQGFADPKPGAAIDRRHLKRVPRSFDATDEPGVVVPDTPAELVDPPGQQLLDQLRRAPRAIEPPRPEGRPDDSA